MEKKFVTLALMLFVLAVLGGCGKLKEIGNDAPPGRIVAISVFKCNCESLVQETVQDTFVDIFFNNTNAKPIKGENGDFTIVGIITMGEGQTGRSGGAVFGSATSGYGSIGGGSHGSSASGTYVTGITIQVYKNGELIVTHSVGQDLRKGSLLSPVTLAKTAANYISTVLVRKNEIGRKGESGKTAEDGVESKKTTEGGIESGKATEGGSELGNY